MEKEKNIDMRKAAGVLLNDRTMLVARSKGKTAFVAPGGKIEEGEGEKEALVRELREELNIETKEKYFEDFGSFVAEAAGGTGRRVEMTVFLVKQWHGTISPSGEVEEVLWINSAPPPHLQIGSICKDHLLPKLKIQGYID